MATRRYVKFCITFVLSVGVVVRLDNDEHVVHPETDKKAGYQGMHGPVVKAGQGADADRHQDGEAAAHDSHPTQECLEVKKTNSLSEQRLANRFLSGFRF